MDRIESARKDLREDPELQRTREHVRESLAEFERLRALSSREIIDALNGMHEDDVRHIVLSLTLKMNNAPITEGLE